MKERPILFSAPMVRALLDGSKTQTRRIMKPQPEPTPADYPGARGHWWPANAVQSMVHIEEAMQKWTGLAGDCCPHGDIGDRLWVRENFCPIYPQDPTYNGGMPIEFDYAATYQHGDRLGDLLGAKKKWKPSIHMPRAACRILLVIVSVRVQRLQDISDADATAEGIEPNWIGDLNMGPNGFGGQGWVPDCGWRNYGNSIDGEPAYTAAESYRSLWESINGAGSWDANPWVWVMEFKMGNDKANHGKS